MSSGVENDWGNICFNDLIFGFLRDFIKLSQENFMIY